MRIRLKIGLLLGVVASVLGWWFWPSILVRFQEIAIFVSNNVFVLIGAALLIIAVLSVSVHLLMQRSSHRKRELDEMMRAAEMVRTRKTKPSYKQEAKPAEEAPVQPQPEIREVSVDPIRKFSVITGGKQKKEKREYKRAPVQISNDLFFQPVVEMNSDAIFGYDVFRQGKQSTHQTPLYVQEGRDRTKAGRATFEHNMLLAAASTARMPIWQSIEDEGANRLFVHITDALIDDRRLWRATIGLFKAHNGLAVNTALIVDAAKLLKGGETLVKERLTKLDQLAENGVKLGLSNFNVDTKAIGNIRIKRYDFAVCDKNDLFAAQTEPEDNQSMLNNLERFSKAKIALIVRDVVCEADVVDSLAVGANYLSGTYFAPPKKLKSVTELDIAHPA